MRDYIIYPHFGILPQKKPDLIYLEDDNYSNIDPNIISNIDPNIISNIALKFLKNRKSADIILIDDTDKKSDNNDKKSDNTDKKIGYLSLSELNNNIITLQHIELDIAYRKKNIAVNIIYILMNILAAYYAPSEILLEFEYKKEMFKIAYELLFYKNDNKFIRKCR